MEGKHIFGIALASIICSTVVLVTLARAWAARRRWPGAVPRLDDVEQRLDRIERAVEAVAVEMERASEAQRFTARVLAERLAPGSHAAADHLGAPK